MTYTFHIWIPLDPSDKTTKHPLFVINEAGDHFRIEVPAGCALWCILAAMTASNQHYTLPSYKGQGAMVLGIRLCNARVEAPRYGYQRYTQACMRFIWLI